MGGQETDAWTRRKKRNLQKALLSALALSGTIAVGLVAPNVLRLLEYAENNSAFNFQIRSVASRLAQKGLIRFVTTGAGARIEITAAGKKVVALDHLEHEVRARLVRRWDKRWRVVIFDIPERRKNVRVRLRAMLHACGFLRLQHSVWVFPHDCEDVVALIKAELHVGKDILYIIVESIEYDVALRKHFGLK